MTSLDVSKNTALTRLTIYQNQIKGKAMAALIESLPVADKGLLRVIQNGNEQNVITTNQVAAANAKGWTTLGYDNINMNEYEVKKAAVK